MLKWLIDVLRQHFGFSQNEIRGLFVLIPVTTALIFLPSLLKYKFAKKDNDYSEDQAILEEWHRKTKSQMSANEAKHEALHFRHFDPNKLSAEEWIKLGFKEDVAYRIVNYRLKGGKYNSPEDLLKIFGINQNLVQTHKNYMILPVLESRAKPKLVTKPILNRPKTSFRKFDLNEADTATFRTINGIGSYWSRRLVKYRDALGGFHESNQVYELYGLDSSLAAQVIASTFLDSATVEKINVNQDSVKVLARHPYISYKTAKAITKYRKAHGDYSTISELRNIISISDSVFHKIENYLKVE